MVLKYWDNNPGTCSHTELYLNREVRLIIPIQSIKITCNFLEAKVTFLGCANISTEFRKSTVPAWYINNVIIVKLMIYLLQCQYIRNSNLDRDTGYTDRGFPWFSSDPPGKSRDSTSIRPWLLQNPSKFIFTNWHYAARGTNSAVKRTTKLLRFIIALLQENAHVVSSNTPRLRPLNFRYLQLTVVFPLHSMLGNLCIYDTVVKFPENDSSWLI